ncbi:hypothetical protein EDB83DRAFT_2311145 [Lactarius deliciosus]|nr:hypothetical protein EDB83DRAFT_2311145 [Lactarius deliciosus]
MVAATGWREGAVGTLRCLTGHGGGPRATAGVRAAVERAASGWRRGWRGAWRYVVLYCTSSPSLVTAVEKILLDTIKLLGIWLLSQYLCTGVKHDIQLVELGPGKGTLVDDILQTLSQLPQSHTFIKHIHLVESSLSLRAVQQKKLDGTAKTA